MKDGFGSRKRISQRQDFRDQSTLNLEFKSVNDTGPLGRLVPIAVMILGVLVASYFLVKITNINSI